MSGQPATTPARPGFLARMGLTHFEVHEPRPAPDGVRCGCAVDDDPAEFARPIVLHRATVAVKRDVFDGIVHNGPDRWLRATDD